MDRPAAADGGDAKDGALSRRTASNRVFAKFASFLFFAPLRCGKTTPSFYRLPRPLKHCTNYRANCTSYSLDARESEENSSPNVSNTSTYEMLRSLLVFRSESRKQQPQTKEKLFEFGGIVHSVREDNQKNFGGLVNI
jgi:hypothetical protein